MHGVEEFYFKVWTQEMNEEYTYTSLLGKPKTKVKSVTKTTHETDVQIWKRINDFISNNKATVINFETLLSSEITTGGDFSRIAYIYNYRAAGGNNPVHGYRVFYKKE